MSFITSHRVNNSVVQTERWRGIGACMLMCVCVRVCAQLCQPARQKDCGRSFFFCRGADERKRSERKEHSFILSFSILPFGLQKITSHLILGDKQLARSAPPWPSLLECVCLCVCIRLVCVLVQKCLPIDFSIKSCSAPHILYPPIGNL